MNVNNSIPNRSYIAHHKLKWRNTMIFTHTYTHIPYNNIFYTDCFLPNDIPIIMWHPTSGIYLPISKDTFNEDVFFNYKTQI